MKILKWFMLTVGLFVIFVVIIFAVMKYMYKPESPVETNEKEKIAQFESKVIGLEGYEARNKMIDSLQTALQSGKKTADEMASRIDSLTTLLTEQKSLIETQNDKLDHYEKKRQSEAEREEKAKKIAKTFETMKAGEMSAILRNIDDSTVMAIYRNMNNRFKKNILLALSSKRAATITERYIESPGE